MIATKTTRVSVILIVDSRKELPSTQEVEDGASVSYYSVLGLPQRRAEIKQRGHWEKIGEVIYEMGNSEHEKSGVSRIIRALQAQNASAVFIDDIQILQESGIKSQLLNELRKNNIELI